MQMQASTRGGEMRQWHHYRDLPAKNSTSEVYDATQPEDGRVPGGWRRVRARGQYVVPARAGLARLVDRGGDDDPKRSNLHRCQCRRGVLASSGRMRVLLDQETETELARFRFGASSSKGRLEWPDNACSPPWWIIGYADRRRWN
jgi:hypothetical protein